MSGCFIQILPFGVRVFHPGKLPRIDNAHQTLRA